ncbi:MAG: RNA methyltransferase [Patescibacteria group bacterium]|jgi:TrmH family RNA methyltransferase
MKIINSLSNVAVKDLVRLKKTGERKKSGLIIVDGWREIKLAIEFGWEVFEIFYCSGFDKKNKKNEDGIFFQKEIKTTEVSREVFIKICYKDKPDGFLAIIKSRESYLKDIKLVDELPVVVLENIEKPGNLGAIIRTCAAVGVAAIIINDNQTDVYNPNVIRASEGQIFTQTLIKASAEETRKWLKANKIKSFAAATSGSQAYTSVDLSGLVAIVLGSEANGLSSEWLSGADKLIKIPMLSGIDSLNVSVAAAIILFETLRQKRLKLK